VNNLELEEYYRILDTNGYQCADAYKNSLLPQYIYKYVPLSDDIDENEKRFKTVEKHSIWCSSCTTYNDPFEFKALYFDEEKMKSEGYTAKQIHYVNEFYEQQKRIILLSSFSADCNIMPMWAHYSNNHQGFCLKYEVKVIGNRNLGDKIYPVLYTDTRIEAHSFVNNWFSALIYANRYDLPPTQGLLKMISHMYLIFSAKHFSWAYENEFRIIFSKERANDIRGGNIKCQVCGIENVGIIAGYNCSKENIRRLNSISKSFLLEPLVQMKTVEDEFFQLGPTTI